MVKEKSGGVIKVKVSLDKRVHDKIEKLAKDSGLSVPKFIAECIEGLALDPLIRLLHDDPALAREIAVKAIGEYLDTWAERMREAGASDGSQAEIYFDIEPEPSEPDPQDEARELLGEILKKLGPIADELGVDMSGNGKGPEPVSSEPPPKAMGRRSRPSPPRRG